MKVEIWFDGDLDWSDVSEQVRDDFTVTHRAASADFHAATNLFNFTLIYNATTYGKLRLMTKRALVRYTDDDDTIQFSGYFLPLTSFEYNGIIENQFCTIEAQDFTELLRVPVGNAEDDDVAYVDYKILDSTDPSHSIVHALFTKIGLDTSIIDTGVNITTTLGAFASDSYEETAFEMLDTLFYEYGYVVNFDNEGKFHPIPWIIASGTAFVHTFNDTNIIDSIKESGKPFEYEGNQVFWYNLATQENTRLYTEDLPWDEDGDFEGYAVLGGYTYPPETNVTDSTTGELTKVYQEFEDTGIRYKTAGRYVTEEYYMDYALEQADFSQILITTDHVVYDRFDAGLIRDIETFYNRRAQIRYNNPEVTARDLFYMHIDATVIYKRAQQKSIMQLVDGSNKLATYDSRFIYDSTTGDRLCSAQIQAYFYGNKVYSFSSLNNVAEGSYVQIVLENGVTATGIVMEKAFNGLTGIYEYEVAGFTASYQAMTARDVTILSRAPGRAINRVENIPSAPMLNVSGPSTLPEEGATYTLNHSDVETPLYQWYYTTTSGIDVAISGATAVDYFLSGDTTLFDTSGVIACQLNSKWADSIQVTKVTRLPNYSDIKAFFSCDDLPLIPDNIAGTHYLQNTWTTTDSWINIAGSILSVSGGNLVTTAAAGGYTGAYRNISSITNATIRVRLLSSTTRAVAFVGTINGVGNTVLKNITVTAGVWTTLDVYAPGALTLIQIFQSGRTAGDTLIFDWVYIGNALYDTVLLDNSGNERHLTISGVTPVPGISGNGLSFDGINDSGVYTLPNTQEILSLVCWFNPTAAKDFAAPISTLKQGTPSSGFSFSFTSATSIRISYGRGAGQAYTSVTLTVPTISFGTDAHWKVAFNKTDTKFRIYRNGILIATSDAITTIDLNATAIALGRWGVGYNDYYIAGIGDEFLYFSSTLSSAQARGLYNQKTMQKAYTFANWVSDTGRKPKYLGTYNAVHPTFPKVGDWWLVYDTDDSPIQRGIYLNVNGTYTRQTADSGEATQYFLATASDILSLANNVSPDYGTAADYGFSNFVPFLAANDAFISNLFAQYIKVQTGGSIRGGNRYDENGTVVDGTVPGFYISASGACKVAGIEFDGSQGGGVQWGAPALIGSALTVSNGDSRICPLDANTVAFQGFVGGNNIMRTYKWSGSAWTQLGGDTNIGTIGLSAICQLNSTDIAFIDASNLQLRTYRWSAGAGTWAQVGAGLTISGIFQAALTPLSATDVALSNGRQTGETYDFLRTYRWSGSSWAQLGSSLTVSGIGQTRIATLSASKIAMATNVSGVLGSVRELRTYEWSGSAWQKIGASLTISGAAVTDIAAMNGSDIVFIDEVYDVFKMYRWSGSAWSQIASAGSTGVGVNGYPTIAVLNGCDFAYLDTTNDSLRTYRFGFAVSKPYAYPYN